MKSRTLALWALVLFGSSGCLRTYRVEQTSNVSAGVGTDGSCNYSSHVEREERQWHGPWVGQPDHVNP